MSNTAVALMPCPTAIPQQHSPWALQATSMNSRPIFQWDATRELSSYDILAFRQIFPRYQGNPAQLSQLPDAGPWAANLAVGTLEILAHYRPVSQMQRWVLPQLYEALVDTTQLLPQNRQRRTRFLATHYRTCAISERIIETCVIVKAGTRKHAVSIRIEGHHSRWIVTALEVL